MDGSVIIETWEREDGRGLRRRRWVKFGSIGLSFPWYNPTTDFQQLVGYLDPEFKKKLRAADDDLRVIRTERWVLQVEETTYWKEERAKDGILKGTSVYRWLEEELLTKETEKNHQKFKENQNLFFRAESCGLRCNQRPASCGKTQAKTRNLSASASTVFVPKHLPNLLAVNSHRQLTYGPTHFWRGLNHVRGHLHLLSV